MTQTPLTVTVTPVTASEPGALPGFDVWCSDCGPVGRLSLKTLAMSRAAGHEDFHASYGRGGSTR